VKEAILWTMTLALSTVGMLSLVGAVMAWWKTPKGAAR
jgi:hypothetical protein